MPLPEKMPIAVFRHPSGAHEMGFVHTPGAFGIMSRIEAEQYQGGFAPISAIGFGVEQPDVQLQMRGVIIGQRRALRRLIKKIRRGHDEPPDTSAAKTIRHRVDLIEILNCCKGDK